MQRQLVLRAAVSEGWRSQDQITIRWDLIDRQSKQVIYSETFTGESQVEDKHSLAASHAATKASLDKVLTDANFVKTLRNNRDMVFSLA